MMSKRGSHRLRRNALAAIIVFGVYSLLHLLIGSWATVVLGGVIVLFFSLALYYHMQERVFRSR